MKKLWGKWNGCLFVAMLAFMLAFVVSGCGKSEQEEAFEKVEGQTASIDHSHASVERLMVEEAFALTIKQCVYATMCMESVARIDGETMTPEEVVSTIHEASEAYKYAAEMIETTERMAAILAQKEDEEDKKISLFLPSENSSFFATAHAAGKVTAPEGSKAWARQVQGAYDSFKAGKRISELMKELGTGSAKEAHEKLQKAEKILSRGEDTYVGYLGQDLSFWGKSPQSREEFVKHCTDVRKVGKTTGKVFGGAAILVASGGLGLYGVTILTGGSAAAGVAAVTGGIGVGAGALVSSINMAEDNGAKLSENEKKVRAGAEITSVVMGGVSLATSTVTGLKQAATNLAREGKAANTVNVVKRWIGIGDKTTSLGEKVVNGIAFVKDSADTVSGINKLPENVRYVMELDEKDDVTVTPQKVEENSKKDAKENLPELKPIEELSNDELKRTTAEYNMGESSAERAGRTKSLEKQQKMPKSDDDWIYQNSNGITKAQYEEYIKNGPNDIREVVEERYINYINSERYKEDLEKRKDISGKESGNDSGKADTGKDSGKESGSDGLPPYHASKVAGTYTVTVKLKFNGQDMGGESTVVVADDGNGNPIMTMDGQGMTVTSYDQNTGHGVIDNSGTDMPFTLDGQNCHIDTSAIQAELQKAEAEYREAMKALERANGEFNAGVHAIEGIEGWALSPSEVESFRGYMNEANEAVKDSAP